MTRDRSILGATLLAATLIVGPAGCRSGEVPPPRRILLITVDTLRADHLGAWGYHRDTSPAIDRLAAESVLVEQAVAQWPLTGPSFASLMSGLYPRTTGRVGQPHVAPPAGVPLLSEFLREQGYTTAAVVSNRVLARREGWNRGFDEYHETWARARGPLRNPARLKSWLSAPRVNELAMPLLDRHREAERLFVWLHYSDPHTPYTLPEGFADAFEPDDPTPVPPHLGKSVELEGLETLGEYVARYDANVLIADRHIGAVLEHARSLGLLEDALVIFTADHGESLGEHDYYFHHGRFPYSPSARVPLLFHDARRFPAPARLPGPVELVDLYPTLRDLVAPGGGPAGLPGSSLIEALRGAPAASGTAFVESEHGRRRFLAAQSLEWKLVVRRFHPRGREPLTKRELYHLATDPLESRDLIAEHPQEALELQRRLRAWLAATPTGDVAPGVETDSELLQALRALGYAD